MSDRDKRFPREPDPEPLPRNTKTAMISGNNPAAVARAIMIMYQRGLYGAATINHRGLYTVMLNRLPLGGVSPINWRRS